MTDIGQKYRQCASAPVFLMTGAEGRGLTQPDKSAGLTLEEKREGTTSNVKK